jgi:hypothetical protein
MKKLLSSSTRLALLISGSLVVFGCASAAPERAEESEIANLETSVETDSQYDFAGDPGPSFTGVWEYFNTESCTDLCVRPTCACVTNWCPKNAAGKPCIPGKPATCFESIGLTTNQYFCVPKK